MRTLHHFEAHRRSVGSRNPRWPQHGILRENFAVHFRDQIVLAIGVIAPYLPELNRIYRHIIFLRIARMIPDYRGSWWPSIAAVVTEGLC